MGICVLGCAVVRQGYDMHGMFHFCRESSEVCSAMRFCESWVLLFVVGIRVIMTLAGLRVMSCCSLLDI